MKWSDIVWKTTYAGAQQARLSFGDEYQLSIVTELNEPDLYELAIFSDDVFIQVEGIHLEGDDEFLDDVLRFQTREEVVYAVRRLESMTGEAPQNVY